MILLELDIWNNVNDRQYFLIGMAVAGVIGTLVQYVYDNWQKWFKRK